MNFITSLYNYFKHQTQELKVWSVVSAGRLARHLKSSQEAIDLGEQLLVALNSPLLLLWQLNL